MQNIRRVKRTVRYTGEVEITIKVPVSVIYEAEVTDEEIATDLAQVAARTLTVKRYSDSGNEFRGPEYRGSPSEEEQKRRERWYASYADSFQGRLTGNRGPLDHNRQNDVGVGVRLEGADVDYAQFDVVAGQVRIRTKERRVKDLGKYSFSNDIKDGEDIVREDEIPRENNESSLDITRDIMLLEGVTKRTG